MTSKLWFWERVLDGPLPVLSSFNRGYSSS